MRLALPMRIMLPALAVISPAPAEVDATRIDALIERFCNGGAIERRNAGTALIRHGIAIWPQFRALLNDHDPDIRRRARLVWVQVAAGSGRGWSIPKPNTPYHPGSGLPLSVLDRRTGVELVLLLPGRAVVDGKLLQLKAPLYFGRYEVTVAEYARGRADLLYFHKRERARLPITSIERKDIRAFLKCTGLRLPTAAEWEYACFANDAQATPKARNRALPVPAAGKNGFSICGMIGNVAELCADGRLRGGSYLNRRMIAKPGTAVLGKDIGFRVVRAPEKVP